MDEPNTPNEIQVSAETVGLTFFTKPKASATSPLLYADFNFESDRPFITSVSDKVVDIIGWPAPFSDVWKSQPAPYVSFDLLCELRGEKGDSASFLFERWLRLIAAQDGLDHSCSIYRVLLDPIDKSISKWARASNCFPVNVPYDYKTDPVKSFSVPFKSDGIRYMDPEDLSYLEQHLQLG